MEHRWGQRSNLRVGVQLHTDDDTVANGYVRNVSISGAFVHTCSLAPIGTLVELNVPFGNGSGHLLASAAAHVTRRTSEGIGVEWCNFAPPLALALLGRQRVGAEERIRTGDGLHTPDAHFRARRVVRRVLSANPHPWSAPHEPPNRLRGGG